LFLEPNTWDALDALEAAGLLPAAEARALRTGYSFLRLVEARLRIVTDRPLTEVPESAEDCAKLARRLGFNTPDRFLGELRHIKQGVRTIYDAITTRERNQ
jgi:glutamate-ammonia-ligase adenylyltransferase